MMTSVTSTLRKALRQLEKDRQRTNGRVPRSDVKMHPASARAA